MPDRPTVAVLGTGIMGAPIAANLCRAGFPVRVWNRTAAKAAPLAEVGASLANTPAQAADGADFVLTMLADGPTVRAVMTETGVLSAMGQDAVWLQTSTVGVEHTAELAELAARAGVALVDAPVLGTKQPAEQGTLTVLEGGPAELSERCRPVFEAIGSRVIRAGEVGAASRLKLVANNWVVAVTNATAECVALAQALDVDPAQWLGAIAGGALDCAYAQVKGKAMIAEELPLSFPLNLAAKDTRLILAAVGDGADLAATTGALAHFERAAERGYGENDMAAILYGCLPD
jgi:3-hydroxyisobutyrate dehydrogenase